MLRQPFAPDYLDELVNMEMSKRIRRLLVLIDAGEITEEQAEIARRDNSEMEAAA